MILRKIKNIIIVTILLGFSSVVWAVNIPNPDPTLFGPDVNVPGLYAHGSATIDFELFDLAELVPPGVGSKFGFYYGSDPLSLTPIFQADDSNNLFATPQLASVYFVNGDVFDQNPDINNPALQNSFTPVGSMGGTNIGFYMLLAGIQIPIFTQALLNPG